MKSERAIGRELSRIKALLAQALPESDYSLQFGAQQALGWVLELDHIAASKLSKPKQKGVKEEKDG